MINLAWGGHTNGAIDTSLLVDVTGRGDYMEPTAAADWVALSTACLRATGVLLTAAPGSSANRPLGIQNEFYAAYRRYLAGGPYAPVAAVPGTSNHGWARAIDITGYEGNSLWISPRTGNRYYVNLPVWNWLQAHAAEYGYDWATGDSSGEAWHWESLTTPGTTTAGVNGATIIQEDDLSAEDVAAINAHTDTRISQAEGRFRREIRARVYKRTELLGAPLWIAGPTFVPRAVAKDNATRHDQDILKGDTLLVDAGDFIAPQEISETAWAVLIEEHDRFRNAIADAVVAKLAK